jgi:hypothetical protein
VFPDGQHFVMVEFDQEASRITHFDVDWFEELARGVAGSLGSFTPRGPRKHNGPAGSAAI